MYNAPSVGPSESARTFQRSCFLILAAQFQTYFRISKLMAARIVLDRKEGITKYISATSQMRCRCIIFAPRHRIANV